MNVRTTRVVFMPFPFWFFCCSLVEVRCKHPGFIFILSPLLFHSSRLGIRKEDLPKYEEQLELKIAKAQLEELKKDALEAMETQKKRYVVNAYPSCFTHFTVDFLQTIPSFSR